MATTRRLLVVTLVAAIVLVSSTTAYAQAGQGGGIVEQITDVLGGIFNQRPTDAESFSATVKEAEEQQEAHQQRLKYGEDTWWGLYAEKSLRAWQRSCAYMQGLHSIAQDYVLHYLPRQVADWVTPSKVTQQRVTDATSAADKGVRGAAHVAYDKAAGAIDQASEGMSGGLDAAAQKAKEAGEGLHAAGDAVGHTAERVVSEL